MTPETPPGTMFGIDPNTLAVERFELIPGAAATGEAFILMDLSGVVHGAPHKQIVFHCAVPARLGLTLGRSLVDSFAALLDAGAIPST